MTKMQRDSNNNQRYRRGGKSSSQSPGVPVPWRKPQPFNGEEFLPQEQQFQGMPPFGMQMPFPPFGPPNAMFYPGRPEMLQQPQPMGMQDPMMNSFHSPHAYEHHHNQHLNNFGPIGFDPTLNQGHANANQFGSFGHPHQAFEQPLPPQDQSRTPTPPPPPDTEKSSQEGVDGGNDMASRSDRTQTHTPSSITMAQSFPPHRPYSMPNSPRRKTSLPRPDNTQPKSSSVSTITSRRTSISTATATTMAHIQTQPKFPQIYDSPNWFFNAQELSLTPSIVKRVVGSFHDERAIRMQACLYIDRVGRVGNLRNCVLSTAKIYVQRYYMRKDVASHPYHDVVAGALLLSSKMNEHYIRTSQLVPALQKALLPNDIVRHTKEKWNEVAVYYETDVAITLTFDLRPTLPHAFLRPLHQLYEFPNPSETLSFAFQLCNISLNAYDYLERGPLIIAVTCLWMAMVYQCVEQPWRDSASSQPSQPNTIGANQNNINNTNGNPTKDKKHWYQNEGLSTDILAPVGWNISRGLDPSRPSMNWREYAKMHNITLEREEELSRGVMDMYEIGDSDVLFSDDFGENKVTATEEGTPSLEDGEEGEISASEDMVISDGEEESFSER